MLFPLPGLGYLQGQQANYPASVQMSGSSLSTATAQILRWYIGILY